MSALLVLILSGCFSSRAEPVVRPDAVAVVNGAVISTADLELATRPSGHDGVAREPSAALEAIIDQELAAQRATALDLDDDPAYQQELARLQAQVDALRRERLSALYYQALAEAEIPDAEVQRHFEENTARIRTEVRVQQILLRDEAAMAQARADILAGAPFDEVAARRFPELPPGRPPWDLGYLRWVQVPPAWDPLVYELAPGETSPILEGPGGRLWLLQVVDRREDPTVTLEEATPAIRALLQARQATSAREAATKELRAEASVVYAKRQGS